MRSTLETAKPNRRSLWAGRFMSALPALLLLVDGGAKLLKPAMMKGTVSLGYREGVIVPLGIVLLICTVLYLISRTAILGAILLNGYLGGAVATHVRVGESVFNIVLPIVLGVLLWGGLWLRDDNLRRLVPVRS